MSGSGNLRARYRNVLLTSCLAAAAVPAWAQRQPPIRPVVPTPAELAPRESPPSSDPRQLPKRPAPPRELAKPQEEVTLDVRGYEASPNAPSELKSALAALLAPYVGAHRSYEDLVNAAAEVTRYLQRESGYYLGYAYIPEQEPRDGIVRIEVLEGRLDRVELVWSDNLPVRREVVEAYLAALRPGEILHVRDVERVVFLVNDLRGISTKFEVTAGSEPGTASLVVTPQPESRWAGRADIDSFGAQYLGRIRISALGSANSLLGRGDSVTANVLVSTGMKFALVGANLPVGANGLKFGGTASMVRYQLDENQFPLGVNGDATSLSVYALYPWIRSRNLNLFTLGAVDANQYVDRQEVAGVEVRKSIRRASIGLTGDLRDNLFNGAVSTFEAGLTAGRVSYEAGPPAGLDDSPNFTKVVIGFNRLQNLVEGRLLLYASLRAQRAMENLDTNEQFRIGGPDAVRAFAPGEGTGDSGAVVTVEMRLLPPESLLGRSAREMVAAVFYDGGQVTYRQDPSHRPSAFVNQASYGGAGLALYWESPGKYALRASLAKPLHGAPKSDQPRSVRLYAQLTRFF